MSAYVSLFLLGLALAADAFAVALSQGALSRSNTLRTSLSVGFAFGLAQAIAPLIGWGLGVAFAGAIESFDHWIAFGLLALVGAKMIWEGNTADPPGEEDKKVTSLGALVMLAIAVSIDAAAAGVTLPTLGAPILVSIAVIGGVTFALSAAGVWIGRFGAARIGPQAEIIGGVILIVIGAKVLFDHHAFG
jgi:putative Mn2+ efflux pump MntP